MVTEPIPGPSKQICGMPFKKEKLPVKIKKSNFRGIVCSTPRKVKLMKTIESKEAHIRKLKKLAKERACSIRQLSNLNDSRVVREIFKDLPSTTANFLISQLKCARRSPQGRRWTVDEKIVALALFKKGPKCYNLLRKFVAMPCKKSLMDLLKNIPFESGINQHILQHINESIKNIEDRVCALIFDEMDIKEHIEYDSHADRIRGFEEKGLVSTNKLANKALVFMVKGLHLNWKQPIAFYFSHEAVSGVQLKQIIIEVIEACQKIAKLEVVSTICDCGTPNVKALQNMGSSVLNPFILVGGKKIFTIFDPPHLLKCTTSLFRRHNLELPVSSLNDAVMEARFGDIRLAYEIDFRTPLIFRHMHKINANHMNPKIKFAMKVNLAAQIMSRTVSSFLYTLLSRGKLKSIFN